MPLQQTHKHLHKHTHSKKTSFVLLTFCYWHCGDVAPCQSAIARLIISMHLSNKHAQVHPGPLDFFIPPPAPPTYQCDWTFLISSKRGQVTGKKKTLEYRYLQNRHRGQTPVASEISCSRSAYCSAEISSFL